MIKYLKFIWEKRVRYVLSAQFRGIVIAILLFIFSLAAEYDGVSDDYVYFFQGMSLAFLLNLRRFF